MQVYSSVYPELKDSLGPAVSAVQAWKATPHSELEVRFGKKNGFFSSSVSREFVDSCIRKLETCDMTRSSDWEETQDFFFPHRGEKARSRVGYDPHSLDVRMETVVKGTLLSHDVETGDKFDIRVGVARETPVRREDVPPCVNPTWVRIKQRRSFFLGGKGDSYVWRYDFSMVWEGASRTEAEQKQKNCDPSFEFEIELVDREYATGKEDAYVAASLLLKAHDFLTPLIPTPIET